ncbi:nuclear transport factor 2 family protein [Geobacter argillaceus]|uniref:Uncharacterized protein DUF4440 n=1 Tax=Geobacter argillaceus TaxID=345631 RepID=A0A562WRH1_9BACT|nr:nuclear transport factor 2 family protein [Geobacter argillaceus]TWJ33009.1 uncharacterized protein DUF4440 [Geobacter argillaceus]
MHRLIAVALFILAACNDGSADRKAVSLVATGRYQALTTRNVGLYLTLISRTYHDKEKDYNGKARELADTLVNSDGFAYRGTIEEIDVTGDHAVVRGAYTMRVRIKGQTLALQGKETIRLQREAGGWRITGGL